MRRQIVDATGWATGLQVTVSWEAGGPRASPNRQESSAVARGRDSGETGRDQPKPAKRGQPARLHRAGRADGAHAGDDEQRPRNRAATGDLGVLEVGDQGTESLLLAG